MYSTMLLTILKFNSVIENLVKVVKNFINVIYLPLATISNEGKRLKEICKSLWKLSCEVSNLKNI